MSRGGKRESWSRDDKELLILHFDELLANGLNKTQAGRRLADQFPGKTPGALVAAYNKFKDQVQEPPTPPTYEPLQKSQTPLELDRTEHITVRFVVTDSNIDNILGGLAGYVQDLKAKVFALEVEIDGLRLEKAELTSDNEVLTKDNVQMANLINDLVRFKDTHLPLVVDGKTSLVERYRGKVPAKAEEDSAQE